MNASILLNQKVEKNKGYESLGPKSGGGLHFDRFLYLGDYESFYNVISSFKTKDKFKSSIYIY